MPRSPKSARRAWPSPRRPALLEALETHGVLVFPELHADDPQQVAFGRALGEPEVMPRGNGEHPEIFIVSLDPAKTQSAEYLKGTFFWHIDGATDDVPNMATMLSARAVAESGGGTEFSNAYAAWEALPDDEKAQYRNLRVVHSLEAAQPHQPRPHRRTGGHVAYPAEQTTAPRLDPPVGPYLAGARSDRRPRRGDGRRGGAGTAGPTARLGHPGAVRLPPRVDRRRSGDVGQPGHHAPGAAVHRRLAPADAPSDARG
ncbi:MAG: TauD/TfdA family dioxygenase [Acidimicrobiales bacterium]